MKLIPTDKKNAVLQTMIDLLSNHKTELIAANQKDLELFNKDDEALYQRLIVDEQKVEGMIKAIQEVREQEDPVGKEISNLTLESGLNIINKTDPFGTILIIYESRPDVTIEAAVLAFKANNKILLKGGKEAKYSNEFLVNLWHQALNENDLDTGWIKLLQLNRTETQDFLANPPEKLDLIVPRGGEKLIDFVKKHATCAVLISGRGNNFLYVSPNADWDKVIPVIINAKTDKISGCNALDKVLIDQNIPDFEVNVKNLVEILIKKNVEIIADEKIRKIESSLKEIPGEASWKEEFLAMKILISTTPSIDNAIETINEHSGHHSAIILTEEKTEAKKFMEEVDSAAVYQNASSRFTDGGQMGVGAELAISTDKLHHRGPLGLKQLVTNKYYVFGNGHIRS